MEGYALERSVSPRLIVRGVYRQVVARQQVVVGKVENAVVAIEVAGHEDYLHTALGSIVEPDGTHHREGLVVIHVVEFVGDDRVF